MGVKRNAVKCLDCDTTVAPENAWAQCDCGHLYVDTSGETAKVGFINEDRVEYAEGQKLGPKTRVERSTDGWADSSSGFGSL